MEHKITEISYSMLRHFRGLISRHFNMRQREGIISQEIQMNAGSEGQAPEKCYSARRNRIEDTEAGLLLICTQTHSY